MCVINSFLLLYSISLQVYVTIYLYILLLNDVEMSILMYSGTHSRHRAQVQDNYIFFFFFKACSGLFPMF